MKGALAEDVHRLGNTLAAARLRAELLMRDPRCLEAQSNCLQHLLSLLCEAIRQSEEIETRARSDDRGG